MEAFNARDFARKVGEKRVFVQDNQSRSRNGVIRGLHYQLNHPQGKLVRAVVGTIFDVAVDLRRKSATFGMWFGVELSEHNRRQLWIPEGFAHGFAVLSEYADVLYKTTEYWNPGDEHTLRWNDPAVGIEWPPCDVQILSDKDANAPGIEAVPVFDM